MRNTGRSGPPCPRRKAPGVRGAGMRAGSQHLRTIDYANVANNKMGKRLDRSWATKLASISVVVLLSWIFSNARPSFGSSTTINNQEPATIKANSALVLIDVLVQDKKNGDAISGLDATDFVF